MVRVPEARSCRMLCAAVRVVGRVGSSGRVSWRVVCSRRAAPSGRFCLGVGGVEAQASVQGAAYRSVELLARVRCEPRMAMCG